MINQTLYNSLDFENWLKEYKQAAKDINKKPFIIPKHITTAEQFINWINSLELEEDGQ